MAEAALNRMIDAQAALVAALGDPSADTLVAAADSFARSLDDVCPVAASIAKLPGAAELLRDALDLCETARVRINYLADNNRRRIDALVEATGSRRTAAYGRDGLLRI